MARTHISPRDIRKHAEVAEGLAYWYLRLNGFLTIENFILHPELGDDESGARTDADVVGVRFSHRNEQGMEDADIFRDLKLPILVIAEVTSSGKCKLNGPWTKPERENVDRLLRALGLLATEDVPLASTDLYKSGRAEVGGFILQLVAIGMEVDEDLKRRFDVLQVTWEQALSFIHDRFLRYREMKKDHGTWRPDGQMLWAISERKKSNFVDEYMTRLGRPTTNE